MKIAFLTEMGFEGKIPADHLNMRTEFAWMHALDANHFCIHDFLKLKGYDHIFIIFPKGRVYLSAEGSQIVNKINPDTFNNSKAREVQNDFIGGSSINILHNSPVFIFGSKLSELSIGLK